jgi:hypothetical protein
MLLLIPAFSVGLLPAHAARLASAPGVALKQSDMSSGFKQTLARATSISSFARDYGVSASTATSKGLVTGYETKFGRRGTTTGLLYIDDQAYAFKSSGGARWAYSVGLTTTGKGRAVSIGHVGDQNNSFVYVQKSKTISISAYVILFRRGSYMALLAASGVTGRFKTGDILHYAQIMDSRMQRG